LKHTNKIIIGIIIACFILVAIVWNISPETPPAEKTVKAEKSQKASPPDKSEDSNKPADDKKERADSSDTTDDKKTDDKKTDDAQEPNKDDAKDESAEALEAINLKDVEMKDIIPNLAQWTGKVIIPHPDVLKQKLTIYSAEKLPRSEALALIYAALAARGFVAEQNEKVIYLKPINQARFGMVPTISADEPLALIKDKTLIVQKFFKLKNYSPSRLQEIVRPLIAEHGYVAAEENTKILVVIDNVANLMRIERYIKQLDIPEADTTVTRIFKISHGDPAEIVQLLRLLLSTGERKSPGKAPSPSRSSKPAAPGGGKGAPTPTTATAVVISLPESPVVLIPEPRRKWIIARASLEDIKQIDRWISELDKKLPIEAESETVQVKYVDVRELTDRLNQTLQQMPGSELKASVLVQPLTQARQVMIFGNAEKRAMIKKFIQEIDIPPSTFETRRFTLKYVDPEDIKKNLDELYTDLNQNVPYWRRRWQTGYSSETVRAIAFPMLKQVTVIASPVNMVKIAKQIKEWDVPIAIDEVKPCIIELRNSDPVKIARLLTTLFTEETGDERNLPWWWWDDEPEKKKKIIGPLYGQLTFEAVPETKKIIVISKIPGAYEVVKKLVEDLDKQVPAELPLVIGLKYADCEDLCEQLNAILNETGTLSPFRLSKRGLSQYNIEEASGQQDASDKKDDEQKTSTGEVTPWWDRARARPDEEMPTSNMIGKIRFIPVYRSKAILVLAAAEYHDSIKEMIRELDKPAKQVLIKAIIVEVSHESMTSLGLRLSSNELFMAPLGENALRVINDLVYADTFGALTLDSSMNVSGLVDLLVKTTDAKILNQPTLWTKDNEEAVFFKGRSVPFIEGSVSSTESTSIRQDVTYRNVGVTLQVRPSITPEKKVDTSINLMISQVEPEAINGNIVTTLLNSSTHLIVEDGQTIMLSGILFRNDSEIVRKLPLLGDLPLLGGLFRHTDSIQTNSELLAFITPYVIDENSSPQTLMEIRDSIGQMETIKEQLSETFEPDN